MTNGDRIRRSTDEELADLRVIGRRFCTIPICEEHNGDCTLCSLEWLREDTDEETEKSPEFLSGYSACLNELTVFLNMRKPNGR